MPQRSKFKKLIVSVLAVFLFAAQVLAVEHSQAAQRLHLSGEVTVVHIDYFDQAGSKTIYYLHDSVSGSVIELAFERKPPRALRSGDKVTVRGRAVGRKLWVDEIITVKKPDGSVRGEVVPAVSEHRAILMVLNMASSPGRYTETTAVAGAGVLFTNPYSVNTVYREASFGQLGFPGDRTTDVVVLEIPTADTCPLFTIANSADAAAEAVGVDLTPYQHKVYLVPPSGVSGCNWIAVGELGSYGSTAVRRSWSTRNSAVVYAHEIGHNLAFHHSATDPNADGIRDNQYGDTSDLMGFCCSQRKFNSVHVDQIGWLDSLAGIRIDILSSGIYDIAPLGSDPASGLPQVLRIDWPDTDRSYYLSYRQPIGLDTGISPSYTGGVSVHNGRPSGIWSYLIRVLTDGERFEDITNDITFIQLGRAADNSHVTVAIDFGDLCVTENPIIGISPAERTVAPSETTSYAVSLKNNDMIGCAETIFDLSASFGSLSADQLTLAPNETETATLVVTAGALDGSFPITVTSVDPNHVGSYTATATLVVDTPCVIEDPVISIFPLEWSVAPGETITYMVSLSNNDGTGCTQTTFGLSASLGSLSTDQLTLAPGVTENATLAITGGDLDGLFPIVVRSVDPIHAGVYEATAVLVVATPCTIDCDGKGKKHKDNPGKGKGKGKGLNK